MSHMDSHQLIAISILAANEGKEIPEFSGLDSEASKVLVSLIRSYDYTASSAFRAKVLGKSEAVKQRLLRSVSDPVKARELRNEFLQSIREIESSDLIFDYIPGERAKSVMKIRELLASARNS